MENYINLVDQVLYICLHGSMFKKLVESVKKEIDNQKRKQKVKQEESLKKNGKQLGLVIVGTNVVTVFEKNIEISEGFDKVVINRSDVTGINVGEEGSVISKSSGLRSATGALVGGALTGGIGLVAGAVVGGASKKKKDNRKYVINIQYSTDGILKVYNIKSKNSRQIDTLSKLLSK